MTTRKITRRGLLAATGAIAAASALPQEARAQAPRRGGTLKVSVSVRCATINPLRLSAGSEYMSADLMYSGLTRLGLDMRPMPDLATEWSGNADATEFVFRLRQGVTFHHGKTFTSDDVVQTVRAVLDARTGSPARAAIGPIESVEADGPNMVKFKLSSPFADLPVAVAHPNARIVPADILAGDRTQLETRAFGTGPFRLDSYDSARLLRVVRNPNYWVADEPRLDAVEQYLFPDLAAEAANFLSRQMDIILDVQQSDYRRISSAPGVVGKQVRAGRFANLVLRMDARPFDDVRVRRALAMSVDRQATVDLVLEGYGRPAHDNAISPEYRFYHATDPVPYDVREARRLLTQAGFPNGVRIPLICSNRPAIRTQVGVAMKEMVRPAGFDLDVQTIPHDTYIANVWRKGNFYVGYWNMRPTEDSMYTLLFTSNAPFADSAWNSASFDGLVAQARATTDEARRRQLYAEAQQQMVREAPYILPFFQDVLTTHHDYVRDYNVHPLQLYFFFEKVWLAR
jgi:peptide/nickel transport system substrate-binding protein